MPTRNNLAYMAFGASIVIVVLFFAAGAFIAGVRYGRLQTPLPGGQESSVPVIQRQPDGSVIKPVIQTFTARGTIASIGDQSFQLQTTEGLRTVLLTSSTIIRQRLRTVGVNELTLGAAVFVVGEPKENGDLVATLVRIGQ